MSRLPASCTRCHRGTNRKLVIAVLWSTISVFDPRLGRIDYKVKERDHLKRQ